LIFSPQHAASFRSAASRRSPGDDHAKKSTEQRPDLIGERIASTIFMGLPVAAWNHGFCRQTLAWQGQFTLP
jgi:hypothetical protein